MLIAKADDIDTLDFERALFVIRKHVSHNIRTDASYPLLPQRIVADVRRGLDKDAIIALDNGMYKNITYNLKLRKVHFIDLCRVKINMNDLSTTFMHKKWRFLHHIMTNINNQESVLNK
jgi:hypothetical protein